jgi:hypothetical protein
MGCLEEEAGNLGVELTRVNVTTDWTPLLYTPTSGPIPRIDGNTIRTAPNFLQSLFVGRGYP